MEYDKQEVNAEFLDLIDSLTDEQFWKYVATWFDVTIIMGIMKEWDTETKRTAIIDIKKNILKR